MRRYTIAAIHPFSQKQAQSVLSDLGHLVDFLLKKSSSDYLPMAMCRGLLPTSCIPAGQTFTRYHYPMRAAKSSSVTSLPVGRWSVPQPIM
jgi:hypothetical protein